VDLKNSLVKVSVKSKNHPKQAKKEIVPVKLHMHLYKLINLDSTSNLTSSFWVSINLTVKDKTVSIS
jgi:hypothetical protein